MPIGPSDRQVQCVRRSGRNDLLGIGQGETTETAARPGVKPPAVEPVAQSETTAAPNGHGTNGDGELVTIDFGGLGPAAPPAA